MKSRFYIIFILVLCQILFPQEAEKKADEKLRLIHADILQGQKLGDQNIRQLVGNVKFQQGAAILTCQRATEFEESERVVLQGDVAFIDTSKSLFGDKITYYESTKIAYVEGNVKLIDSTKMLTADRIRYLDEKEEAYADGHVFLFDEKERIDLVGEHAEYFRETGYAKVTGPNAVLTKKDSTATDSTDNGELVIHGLVFQMFDDGDRFLVSDSVRVIRGDIHAVCDSLEYLNKESIIKLGNSPQVHQERQYLTGKSVALFLKESEVTAIHIIGNAIATSTVDSTVATAVPYDLLRGEDMMVYVTDEKIDSVLIKERATSYYHVLEDGKEKGLNKALGDALFIRFVQDTLTQVRVMSNPSSSTGEFHPPAHKAKLEAELLAELAKLNISVEPQAPPSAAPGDTLNAPTADRQEMKTTTSPPAATSIKEAAATSAKKTAARQDAGERAAKPSESKTTAKNPMGD